MRKGDIKKVYVIEKTNQYGTLYYSLLIPGYWTVSLSSACMYDDQQQCKNRAAQLLEEFVERNRKWPDVFPVIEEVKVRTLEIKLVK